MNKQIFLNEITLNFNLREPHGNKPTCIYLVIRILGKQIKMAACVKVYPQLWDRKKQEAIIGFNLSKLDILNNNIVNKQIIAIRIAFEEFKSYICQNPNLIGNINQILRNYIYKNMAKKDDKSATRLLNEALSKAYSKNANVKDSTKKQNYYRLKSFFYYIKKNCLKDDITLLTQDNLDDYQQFLLDEAAIYAAEIAKNNTRIRGGGIQSINDKCEIVKRLINDVLSIDKEYRALNISEVKYRKIEDSREQDDKKRVPLTNDELQLIRNIELNSELSEYRDIFYLQCNVGQRISDMGKLFSKDITFTDGNFVIETLKEDTDAVILNLDIVNELRSKYSHGFRYIKFNNSFNSKLNLNIKKIFNIAKIEREIEWIESKGEKKITYKRKLCDEISSHFARHTFITNMILKGWEADKLCYLTGHKNDKMIREIYTHLTKEDKIKIAIKERNRVENNINKEENNDDISLIDEAKSVLNYLGADADEYIDLHDIDILHRLLYGKYEGKLLDLGLDFKIIKSLYNAKDMDIKEKKEALRDLINEFKIKNNK